jgi:hypothetical protein
MTAGPRAWQNCTFSNENNESATRSEEEFVRALTVCCGFTKFAASEVKLFFGKPYM